MLFYIKNNHEIRTIALLEAVRFCGSEQELSILIGVERSGISKWINQPDRIIPYQKALLIEKVTGISVKRLLPDEIEVNAYLRDNYGANKLIFREILKDKILIEGSFSLSYLKPNRPIIISTKGLLISGLAELKIQQATSKLKIKVVVLDLEVLLLEKRFLGELSAQFLISERVSIGLCLEQLLGNRQGQRSDLVKNRGNKENNENYPTLCRSSDQVIGRTEAEISKIIGLGSKDTYHRAKQVYKQGIPALIEMLDEKQISIARAAKISKLSEVQQGNAIQTEIEGVK